MAQNLNLGNLGQYVTVNTAANTVTFTNTIAVAAISANGGVGTSTQVLSSNGTVTYWANSGISAGKSIAMALVFGG
jgi:hypothetical protein